MFSVVVSELNISLLESSKQQRSLRPIVACKETVVFVFVETFGDRNCRILDLERLLQMV